MTSSQAPDDAGDLQGHPFPAHAQPQRVVQAHQATDERLNPAEIEALLRDAKEASMRMQALMQADRKNES